VKLLPHPIAECFPLLPLVELQAMSLDIAKNGLIHPIVIFEGKILEGRNRYRACQMAGIVPPCEDYTGTDPRGYVISANAMRRDLTKGQRACVAQELATAPEGNPNRNSPNSASYELTMDETAQKMGVGLTSVKDARAIFKADLRVYEQVKNGLITLNQGTIKSGVKKKASKATIKKANVDSLPAIVDPAIFEGLMKTGQFTREQAISVAVKNAQQAHPETKDELDETVQGIPVVDSDGLTEVQRAELETKIKASFDVWLKGWEPHSDFALACGCDVTLERGAFITADNETPKTDEAIRPDATRRTLIPADPTAPYPWKDHTGDLEYMYGVLTSYHEESPFPCQGKDQRRYQRVIKAEDINDMTFEDGLFKNNEDLRKEIRTPGLRRRLIKEGTDFKKFTDLTNTPIQGGCADAVKMAILALEAALPSGTGIVAMLHDELVIETDTSIAAEMLTLAKQKMEESAGLVFKDVPMLVEGKIVDSWE